jgi:hypothetical protein
VACQHTPSSSPTAGNPPLQPHSPLARGRGGATATGGRPPQQPPNPNIDFRAILPALIRCLAPPPPPHPNP